LYYFIVRDGNLSLIIKLDTRFNIYIIASIFILTRILSFIELCCQFQTKIQFSYRLIGLLFLRYEI